MDLVAWWQDMLTPWVRAHFGRSERGAALVEYALLLALIAVACVAALSFLGGKVNTKYSDIANSVG